MFRFFYMALFFMAFYSVAEVAFAEDTEDVIHELKADEMPWLKDIKPAILASPSVISAEVGVLLQGDPRVKLEEDRGGAEEDKGDNEDNKKKSEEDKKKATNSPNYERGLKQEHSEKVAAIQPLQRIIFEANQLQISQFDKDKIDEIVEKILSDTDLRIRLDCFSSERKTGNSEARRISLKRGLSIRNHLISKKIISDKIIIRAIGYSPETKAVSNDRVDIFPISH